MANSSFVHVNIDSVRFLWRLVFEQDLYVRSVYVAYDIVCCSAFFSYGPNILRLFSLLCLIIVSRVYPEYLCYDVSCPVDFESSVD